jgi:hypothetical protein
MEVVLVLLFVAVAGAYISMPLARGVRKESNVLSLRLEAAGARKAAALGALVDIENERLIGKLSTRDFELLRDEYEAEALAALRELDAIEQGEADDDELEAEIAAIRARMECPECGGLRVPGEACSKCGHES